MALNKGAASAGEQRFRTLVRTAGWSCRVQTQPKLYRGIGLGRIFVYLHPGNTFGPVWTFEGVESWDAVIRDLIREIEARSEVRAKFTPADLHLD